MADDGDSRTGPDLSGILDAIAFPEAYRVTYVANAIVFPAYAAVKRDFGLSRDEFILLICLSHFAELTAQDVARIWRRPRNSISRAVHRMMAEGCLDRAPDPFDGRQVRLRITPAGRALYDRISVYMKDRQEVVLAGLSDDERQVLSAILKKAALHAATLPE